MTLTDALAFKTKEIEELADVYFFRPLGALIAYAAMPVGISPTALTIFSACVGTFGGLLLYDERRGLVAFGLLILHGIFDSADGQLARLTGRTSEFGRILDGLAGYVTEGTAYVAIAAGYAAHGGSSTIFLWLAAAGVASTIHAQLYDYHRTTYGTVVLRERAPEPVSLNVPGWAGWLSAIYHSAQRRLIGLHADVEAALRKRSVGGRVLGEDRERYRETFYWPVRGWNFFGDNTRFYGIGAAALVHHLDWFFVFVVGPMNIALVLVWIWQQRADRRFLVGMPGR